MLQWMATSSSEGTGEEGEALYTGEGFGCTELRGSEDKAESLWVTLRGKDSKAQILLGVCHRPPNQDEVTYSMSGCFTIIVLVLGRL